MNGKENAILIGPFIGELGWESLRFAPHFLWLKLVKYIDKDVKFIVMTREDRFDLYGSYADIFVPLRIPGDGIKYTANCFKLENFNISNYMELVNKFYNKYSSRYNILEHIYPKIEKTLFAQRGQFQRGQRNYSFLPRKNNKETLEDYIKDYGNIKNKYVVIAPRFRKNLRRNWNGWKELYDIIEYSNLKEKINFIICGKEPDYIPDNKNRFIDINNIKIGVGGSTIGLTIEAIRKSYLTIGSQSGIPNLSLILKTPVLEWGHQKKLHSEVYNILKTKVIFLDDLKYKLPPEIIFNNMKKYLDVCLKKEGKKIENDTLSSKGS
jgi:hypothetical protein